ncbi:hypothetical protein [Enterococcus sp.]|uniref:hypothetical protein n=1 Tax=Enterococcus sp. TaxID=35783 RepID=UPI002FC5E57B
MSLDKIIKLAYLCFTVYAVSITDITTLTMKDTVPAVIFMWAIFMFFSLGYQTNTQKNLYSEEIKNKKAWLLNRKTSTIILLASLSVLSSVLSAKYYTGQSPITVLTGIFSDNRSLYAEYQLHSKINNISSFSIIKIPYILMMFYVKLSVFYFSITYLLIKVKISFLDKIILGMVIGSHIYFGLARGTNYELFEIVMLIIFITLTKKNRKKMSIKLVGIVGIVGTMVFLFYERISSRGFEFNYMVNMDYNFNPNGIISTISKDMVFMITLLYDYFGFGFYYISKYIMEVWFVTPMNFAKNLIPYSYAANNTSIMEVVSNQISMGSRWHPDLILLINSLGVIISLILVYFIGKFSSYIRRENEDTAIVKLTEFIVLLQMVSFPIGNFIFISSASTLIVLILVVVWLWKILINKKIII